MVKFQLAEDVIESVIKLKSALIPSVSIVMSLAIKLVAARMLCGVAFVNLKIVLRWIVLFGIVLRLLMLHRMIDLVFLWLHKLLNHNLLLKILRLILLTRLCLLLLHLLKLLLQFCCLVLSDQADTSHPSGFSPFQDPFSTFNLDPTLPSITDSDKILAQMSS